MQKKKVVITGGPGTGKSSVIQKLQEQGYHCFPEISREVILEAKEKGIEQLFLTDPLLFSEMLLNGRINQFNQAEDLQKDLIFLDRGIPDVVAYLKYAGSNYPDVFERSCLLHKYEQVFLLPPWKEIYQSDNERYENFEQASKIHLFLEKTYKDLGYQIIEVPKTSIEERAFFILKKLEQDGA